MNCPVDQATMRPLQDKGITMDWCELCDEIWLDAGELTPLTQAAADLPELPTQPAHPPRPQPHQRPACPRCRQPLEERPYAEGQTLRVDRCPRCRGVWLERGELHAIYGLTHGRRPPPATVGTTTDSLEAADLQAITIVGIVLLIILLAGVFFTVRR